MRRSANGDGKVTILKLNDKKWLITAIHRGKEIHAEYTDAEDIEIMKSHKVSSRRAAAEKRIRRFVINKNKKRRKIKVAKTTSQSMHRRYNLLVCLVCLLPESIEGRDDLKQKVLYMKERIIENHVHAEKALTFYENYIHKKLKYERDDSIKIDGLI